MTKRNRVREALDLLAVALRISRKRGLDDRAARIEKAQNDLTPPARPWPAIDAAKVQSQNGPAWPVGSCQLAVRTCYGVPSVGDFDGDGMADAEDAWKAAKDKHPTGNTESIPRGFPIFWAGGSHDNGHVAISAGNGLCWSTDIKRPGMFDLVPVARIHEQWGLTLLGWAEVYDGFRIEHGGVK